MESDTCRLLTRPGAPTRRSICQIVSITQIRREEETNRAAKDSLIGSLARTELETVLGLPAPALFTPVTLNSYSTSPSSPSTVNLESENNKTCKLIMKTEDMCRVNTAKNNKHDIWQLF